MNNDFDVALEAYPWESKDQKIGYLALVQYLLRFGVKPDAPIDAKAAFFIQKDIDSHAYWMEMVSSQVADLQTNLEQTMTKLDGALFRIDQLELMVRAQMTAIEALTKRG